MTRQSYRHELAVAMTMPVAIAMVEGGVAGVLAVKVFGVHEMVLALITAAPMFANLTSFIWARLGRGRNKVHVIVAQQVALLVLLCAIAALPAGDAGGLALAGVVVASRCLLSGIITMRSTVWRQNYPRHLRGRITGRLVLIAALIVTVVSTVVGLVLDANPHAFRIVYPVAALVASAAVIAMSRVRIRGWRVLRDYEMRPAIQPTPHGEQMPVYEYDPADAKPSIWSVLKHDRTFRTYMTWQFMAGMSNMMCEPPLTYMVSDQTQLNQPFVVSTILVTSLPMGLAMLSLPVWARLLDRMHITRFRVRQAWWWVAAQVLMGIGGLLAFGLGGVAAGVLVIAVGRFVLGISRGGGLLAWQLGHNDFASRNLTAVYMGAHLTLTGIRGAFTPFLGMALYAGWDPLRLGSTTLIPGFAGIGPWVFFVAAVLSLTAAVGFYRLSRSVGHRGEPEDMD